MNEDLKCPVCGKSMIIKETVELGTEKVIKFAVCNNFRCDFDEEIVVDKN